MSTPDVSVIIPARDAAATLGRTLRALAAQEFDGSFEVIVIDNGSLDDTPAVVQAAGTPVRVLRLERGEGPGRARNAGAEAARASALAFTDADCEPARGWLAAGVSVLAGADLVQGAVHPPPDAPIGPFDRTVWVRAEGLYETANLFVRRECWERAGGFQELLGRAGDGAPFGEDALFGWRARRAGARTAFAPEAVVHHAVFPRSAREFVAERARLSHFPALAAQVPELRRQRFFAGCFLSRRTAALDVALAGAALAMYARRPLIALAAAAPYTAQATRAAAGWGPRFGPRVLAATVAADLVGLAALAQGSVRARTLVL